MACTPRIESAVATQKSCRRSFPQKEPGVCHFYLSDGEMRTMRDGETNNVNTNFGVGRILSWEKRTQSSDWGPSGKEELNSLYIEREVFL